MGKQDWKDDRQRRLAARYPDRAQPGAVTHVVVDGEVFAVGPDAIEFVETVPAKVDDLEPEKKKGGRPKGSKNKKAD